MSGQIKISEKDYWSASGVTYTRVRMAVVQALQETKECPSLLQYLNDPDGYPEVLDIIDLTGRPQEELLAFRTATIRALEIIKNSNVKSSLPPEHYKDLIQLIELLISRLAAIPSS